MPLYLLLVKISPEHTDDFVHNLENLPENPSTGVTLYYTYNVFGTWDTCIWFEADNHDDAMNFVQNKIRPIPGVVKTDIMPTTPIREYKSWNQ